jgi:hypothetical protein
MLKKSQEQGSSVEPTVVPTPQVYILVSQYVQVENFSTPIMPEGFTTETGLLLWAS